MEEQWKVTAENLESFIEEQKDIAKNRLLILNNPGNPSGTVYTANELKELSEVCRKLNITVLSDEIYGLLNFKGQHEICLLSFLDEKECSFYTHLFFCTEMRCLFISSSAI